MYWSIVGVIDIHSSYNLPALHSWLSARPPPFRTHPRIFDAECLHTPYLPPPTASGSVGGAGSVRNWSPRVMPSHAQHVAAGEPDLIDLNDPAMAHSHSHSHSHAGAGAPTYAQAVQGDGDNAALSLSSSLSRKKEKRRPASSKRPGSLRRDSSRDGREGKNGNGNGNGSTDMDNLDSEDEWEEEEWVPDVFLFEYGTVVLWGMTEKEEKAFLKQLYVCLVADGFDRNRRMEGGRREDAQVCMLQGGVVRSRGATLMSRRKFENERLNTEDVEMEDLNFYYADYSRYVSHLFYPSSNNASSAAGLSA